MRRAICFAFVSLLLAVGSQRAEGQNFGGYRAPAPRPNPGGPPASPRAGLTANNASTPTGQPSVVAELTVLRESRFKIPIVRPQGDPLAVELFVSTDQGATWKTYAKEPPNSEGFLFEAPGDGEYWFASRTYFRQGVWPTGGLKPEVRVRVDTAEPKLDFQAFVGGSGEIVVQWNVADPNLAPESFAIEYRPGPNATWQPVELKADAGSGGPLVQGQHSWWPKTTARLVFVRALVRDKANNTAVAQRQLFLPKIARQELPPEALANSSPRQPTGAAGIPWRDRPAAPVGPLADVATAPPARAEAWRPPPRPESQTEPARSGPLTRQEGGWESRGVGPAPAEQHPPVAGDVHPPVAKRVSTGAAAEKDPPLDAGTYQLPRGERATTTNSPRFHLEYDVDSVGPSGVDKVELWQTTDGGRSWERRMYDEDLQSPVEVEVSREGVYGFRVVIVGKNGLASRTPRAGDLADIWIAVDSSPPTGRLTSAEYGRGARIGQLDIRWEANDQWLTERPVTLKFSDSLDGPWTTIATGLPNSGQYFWTAGPRTPASIYLRLEVRDRAGNLFVDQLREPLAVEGLSPRGRIRGFRPLDPPQRDAFRGRHLR